VKHLARVGVVDGAVVLGQAAGVGLAPRGVLVLRVLALQVHMGLGWPGVRGEPRGDDCAVLQQLQRPGTCVLGDCQCQRGFFGLDCSLFLDRGQDKVRHVMYITVIQGSQSHASS